VTRNPLGITRGCRTLHEYLLGDDSHGTSGQAAESGVRCPGRPSLIPSRLPGTGGPPPAFRLGLHAQKYSNVRSRSLVPPHRHASIYQRCQPTPRVVGSLSTKRPIADCGIYAGRSWITCKAAALKTQLEAGADSESLVLLKTIGARHGIGDGGQDQGAEGRPSATDRSGQFWTMCLFLRI
jgi:hypothetical protein